MECVDNAASEIGFMAALMGLKLPEIGAIYTSDGLDPQPGSNKDCVFLLELKQYTLSGLELSYRCSWFRLLQHPMSISDDLFSHAPETCEA